MARPHLLVLQLFFQNITNKRVPCLTTISVFVIQSRVDAAPSDISAKFQAERRGTEGGKRKWQKAMASCLSGTAFCSGRDGLPAVFLSGSPLLELISHHGHLYLKERVECTDFTCQHL